VQKGRRGEFISIQNDPGLASFDITPSPHRRINAPRSLLAFAHIHGEAGTPTLAIWSAMVGRNGPFLCAEGKEGVNYFIQKVDHSAKPGEVVETW
jgi:hypothetical protein